MKAVYDDIYSFFVRIDVTHFYNTKQRKR